MSGAVVAPRRGRGLRVELAARGVDIVDDVSFAIRPARCSAWSASRARARRRSALALLGHARRGARVAGGACVIDGRDLLAARPSASCARCAAASSRTSRRIPATALNPALRIGTPARRGARRPTRVGAPRRARGRASREMLDEVALPADDAFLRRYPHQLSGGQQQRVGASRWRSPAAREVIVLDEPTTGLDVDDAGARARARCASSARRTASRRSTSATTSPWSPTWPTAWP